MRLHYRVSPICRCTQKRGFLCKYSRRTQSSCCFSKHLMDALNFANGTHIIILITRVAIGDISIQEVLLQVAAAAAAADLQCIALN